MMRFLRTLFRVIISLFRREKILTMPIDLLGDSPLESNHEWVSRHHIAEQDLVCPRCHGVAAARGDYRQVQKWRFPNGTINEAVRCGCTKKANGIETRCGTLLFASPDTEHGDHLVEGPTPACFYLFRRIDPLTAAREAAGEDVIQVDTDNETITVAPQPSHKEC